VTEEIPVIVAPTNLRTATTPTSLTKAEPAAPPGSQAVSGLVATRPPAITPGTGGPGTSGRGQPAASTATYGGPGLPQITTARPADTYGAPGSAAATAADWAAEPKRRRRRRSRLRRRSADLGLPEALMLRPLFVDESPLDEVLATVRAESAGITPRPGMWPAAIVVAVAVLMMIILAAGVLLAFAG
jgi:hypothetical protein